MAKSTKRKQKRERFEKRFVPQSTVDVKLVFAIGAVSALCLGAGAWGQWGAVIRSLEEVEPFKYAPWILAAGTVLLGIAIWIGTSGDAVVRVGSGGVGEEKSGAVRRMPWYQIEAVTWEEGVLLVRGKDEAGTDYAVRVKFAAAPQAVALIAHEANTRIPDQVDLSEEVLTEIGEARKHAGESVATPPMQVVGKRCSESDKIISFEPDVRICPRCERPYHRAHLPEKCACGASLTALQEQAG